jgi:hypothetical protein
MTTWYGTDYMHALLDSAREARLQDEANATAYEEEHLKPEVGKATALLFRAGVMHIKASDAELLGREIMVIAGELTGPTGDPSFWIADAARALEKRIGGLERLEAYVGQLRAANKESA